MANKAAILKTLLSLLLRNSWMLNFVILGPSLKYFRFWFSLCDMWVEKHLLCCASVAQLLTNKLLTQGYCRPRLIKTIKKIYFRHHVIVDKFGVSVSKMILGRFWDPIVSSLVFLYLFCNIHMTGVSTELGGAYFSGAPGLTSIWEVQVLT